MHTKFEKAYSYAILIIISSFFIFPIYWAITMSFKLPDQIFVIPPEFFPRSFHMDNYFEIFKNSPVMRYFLNSLIVASITVMGTIFVSTAAGFGFARYKLKTSKLTVWIVFIIRSIPGLVYIVPFYIIFQKVNLIDTLTGIVICYVTFSLPFAIWLFMGFYEELPSDIFESAIIDGCSEYGLFTTIALPLVKSGVVVISILVFMGAWNEFTLALVLIFSEDKKTLPYGINSMIQQNFDTPFGSLAAAGTIAMLPAVIFSLTTQKYIVRGLTAGAVKG